MAVMADFSRLPTQRKVLVFVVIGALLGLLYFQFVLKPLKDDVEEADAAHNAKKAKNNQLDKDKDDFKALKLRMCQLKRIIDENQTALPTEAELPAFFETLNRKVLESGVEVRSWAQGKEEPIESFIKVPVRIELTGSYMQIKKFFASLIEKRRKPGTTPPPTSADTPCGNSAPIEEHERIVSIENLRLDAPTVVNHEIRMTATFTAATYRAEDKNAAAAGPQVRKSTAAPAPAPAGAGSAPLPNAATPAGAKARVDGAMQKDEDRTRKAPNTQDVQPSAGSAKLKGGL
jgi:type IV pilus assembly protein PilO